MLNYHLYLRAGAKMFSIQGVVKTSQNLILV